MVTILDFKTKKPITKTRLQEVAPQTRPDADFDPRYFMPPVDKDPGMEQRKLFVKETLQILEKYVAGDIETFITGYTDNLGTPRVTIGSYPRHLINDVVAVGNMCKLLADDVSRDHYKAVISGKIS